MRKSLPVIGLFWVMALMVACSSSVKVPEDTRSVEGPSLELSAIDSLMWRQPDSALAQLQAFCNSPEADSLDEFNGHYCQLLISELLYKNDWGQSNREELLQAVAYFDSLVRLTPPLQRGAGGLKNPQSPDLNDNITFLDARAHYINGVGYYEKDSIVQACAEYLKTLELMEAHFEEREMEDEKEQFMAYTYTRLTDLFSDLYLHEQALYFGKQALEYYRRNAAQNHIAWALNEIGSHYDMMGNFDSADFYYRKSLAVLPDTFNLAYRDVETHLAYMSYKKDGFDTLTMNSLYDLLSKGESEKEYLSRCLAIAEIYYLEHQFDSAWIYFDKVFERTISDDSKKLAAKRLLEICKITNNDSVVSKYAACLAQFATGTERQGAQNSALIELYRQYGQNKAERTLAKRNEEINVFVNWFVAILAVIIVLIIVFINGVRRRNKELLKQKQLAEAEKKHQQWMADAEERLLEELRIQKDRADKEMEKTKKRHEEELEAERQTHRMEQAAMSGRLKRSNQELRELKDQIKQMDDLAAKTEVAASFDEEPICRLIMERVSEGQFKSKIDYIVYKDSALDKQQLLDLRLAVDRHFGQFTTRLKKAYPELTNSDLDYCCLYLLGLTDADVSALMQRAYYTVSERSRKLKGVFGSDEPLSAMLRGFANESAYN